MTSDMDLFYSTNAGISWSSKVLDPYNQSFTMGIFVTPHCTDILRTVFFNGDVYSILHSSDYGSSWETYLKDVEIAGWIAGNACVLYVSNSFDLNHNGIFHSTDQGKTWVFTWGPLCAEIDDQDFRNISVVGGGAIAYAGDNQQGFLQDNNWRRLNIVSATICYTHWLITYSFFRGVKILFRLSLVIVLTFK